MITRDHYGTNSSCFAGRDGRCHFHPGWVNDSDHSYEGEISFESFLFPGGRDRFAMAKCHPKHTHTLRSEVVVRGKKTATPGLIQLLTFFVDPDSAARIEQ